MKFPIKILFSESEEDCQWLRETYLTSENLPFDDCVPEFSCFLLYGNIDCQMKIELYANSNPLVTEEPVAVFEYRGDGIGYRIAE